ncbi:MAG: CHAP domain-containing protein [Oscillospiraceae bacterium]|jgi:hypothetical protein|nr:CHAP domain-containing protein [Oscillospiraceae bacterium]
MACKKQLSQNGGTRYGKQGYQSGDIVLFSWKANGVIDHVGFVESVSADGLTLNTIEGNTQSADTGDQSNGDGVYRKARNNNKTVVGAYRIPNLNEEIKTMEQEKVTLEKPDSWAQVACDWAVAQGIFKGGDNGDFQWHKTLTKQDLAVVLYNLKG